MGVKIINRSYKSQYRAAAQDTDWLLGNVGDWIRLNLEIEVAVEMIGSVSNSVMINNEENTISLNNGASWSSYGFDIGDTVTMTYDEMEDANNDGTYVTTPVSLSIVISNLYGNVLEYISNYTFPQTMLPSDRGNLKWENLKFTTNSEPEGIKFKYTLLSNENYQSQVLSSFIDSSITEFSYAGVNSLVIGASPTAMNSNGMQSGMAIDNCSIEKTAVSGHKYSYIITCDFMLSSIFEDISNLEDIIAPSVLFNAGSLTDNFLVEMFPKWNNPNVSIKNDLLHTARLGNTGWFNENYNGLDNDFTLDNIVYKNNTGDVIETVDFTQVTIVEAEISGIQNLNVASEFGFGFAWIPENEEDFHSKNTPFHKNLLINTIGDYGNGAINLDQNTGATVFDGFSFGTAKMNIVAQNNIMFSSDVAGIVKIRIRLEPNSDFTTLFNSKDESDRKFVLWCSVADNTTVINFSNRVSVLLDFGTMVKVIPPAGPLPGLTNFFLEHPEDTNETGIAQYDGFVEDDILCKVNFVIDKTTTELVSFNFGVEVDNFDTGSVYTLEELSKDVSIFPRDINGIQQIEVADVRGFKCVSGNNKNIVEIYRNTDLDSGDDKGYTCLFATKIRWEDWISRNGVPDEFFDISKNNNGLNNDWNDYSTALLNHNFFFFIETVLIENGELKKHKNRFQFDFIDYDENLEITSIINYYKGSNYSFLSAGLDQNGNPIGVILNNDKTIIEIIYENNFEDFDFAKAYATICLEVLNGAGEFEFRQLSSVWSSEDDNPLIPLENETHLKIELLAPRIIKTVCRINPELLTEASAFKISGRLGCYDESAKANFLALVKVEDCSTSLAGLTFTTIYVDVPDMSAYVPEIGDVIYLNSGMTTIFEGNGNTHALRYFTGGGHVTNDYLIEINNSGIVTNVIDCKTKIITVEETISTCETCFKIAVEVPVGQTRDVIFSSTFAPGGGYLQSQCADSDLTVIADSTVTINATTSFSIGMLGDNTFGDTHLVSHINISVQDGGVTEEQVTIDRRHKNTQC